MSQGGCAIASWTTDGTSRSTGSSPSSVPAVLGPGRPDPAARGRTGSSVDLGCGSGAHSRGHRPFSASRRWSASTRPMRCSTRREKRSDAETTGLRFARGDLGKWTSRGDHDLVLANASLQWVPDHPGVLTRWWAALVPGGQLAVQVPANADHRPTAWPTGSPPPSRSSRRSTAFRRPDPVGQNVLAPEQYSTVLDGLGASEQHVRLQVYPHHLESTASVVEWTRGTTLARFTKAARTGPRRSVHRRLPCPRHRHARRRLAVLLPVQAHLMWARVTTGTPGVRRG